MRKLKELKPRQVKKVFEISAIIIVVLVAVGVITESLEVCVIGFVLMVAAMVFNISLYRCPHCGRHLGRDGGDFCRQCGAKLDEA